jgi:hypothetical protein
VIKNVLVYKSNSKEEGGGRSERINRDFSKVL